MYYGESEEPVFHLNEPHVIVHSHAHPNRLQQTATDCNRLQQDATRCNKMQQDATDCNRLQHTVNRKIMDSCSSTVHTRVAHSSTTSCSRVLQGVAGCCMLVEEPGGGGLFFEEAVSIEEAHHVRRVLQCIAVGMAHMDDSCCHVSQCVEVCPGVPVESMSRITRVMSHVKRVVSNVHVEMIHVTHLNESYHVVHCQTPVALWKL